MKIKGTLTCDLHDLKIKYHEETNTRTAIVGLKCKLTASSATKQLGEELSNIGFGGLLCLNESDYSFGYKSLKPSLICEPHTVWLCGHIVTNTLPVIKELTPVEGEVAVVADIKIPVPVTGPGVAGALAAAVGSVIDVRFEASQVELPLGDRAGAADFAEDDNDEV